MVLQVLVYILLTTAFVAAAFFIPKWLYWITPHSSSAYEALAEQYGPKVAWAVFAVLVIVAGTGMYLLARYGE